MILFKEKYEFFIRFVEINWFFMEKTLNKPPDTAINYDKLKRLVQEVFPGEVKNFTMDRFISTYNFLPVNDDDQEDIEEYLAECQSSGDDDELTYARFELCLNTVRRILEHISFRLK